MATRICTGCFIDLKKKLVFLNFFYILGCKIVLLVDFNAVNPPTPPHPPTAPYYNINFSYLKSYKSFPRSFAYITLYHRGGQTFFLAGKILKIFFLVGRKLFN
jgi:hypothetical protein